MVTQFRVIVVTSLSIYVVSVSVDVCVTVYTVGLCGQRKRSLYRVRIKKMTVAMLLKKNALGFRSPDEKKTALFMFLSFSSAVIRMSTVA